MRVEVRAEQAVNVELLPHEAVERKGIGHPDTLCDAIAELASRKYSKAVRDLTDGRLPHHYFDKVMLMGGAADMALGHGQLVEPYRVLFAGKVTRRVGALEFPVIDILAEAAAEVLGSTLRGFDPEHHLVVTDHVRDYQGPAKRRPRYRPENIEAMPRADQPGRVSNDVNICTGFAPLTHCERLVLLTENYLNSTDYKVRHPYTGMDIKVAGLRIESEMVIVVNMPFIAQLVPDMSTYRELTNELTKDLRNRFVDWGCEQASLDFNPQDISGLPYLTVTGSVADTGDVGVVGRGNRANGLITPMRPMSIEAVSGKSPIDNTGKLYGHTASRMAADIHQATSRWNNVTVVTFRDRPLEDPAYVFVALDGDDSAELAGIVRDVVRVDAIAVPGLTSELIDEGIVAW